VKCVYRALIVASGIGLASCLAAQDQQNQNAPPPATPSVTGQNPASSGTQDMTSAAPNTAAPVPVPQDSGVAPAPPLNTSTTAPVEAAPPQTSSTTSAKSTSSRSARRAAKPPKQASPAPSNETRNGDQNAAVAAGAAGSTTSDQQPPSTGSGTTAGTAGSANPPAESAVPPAPVAEQRPVVVNDEATANTHTASRSLWLLIVGFIVAVLIVAVRLARRRRDEEISILGDRTGPIRTDGGPALSGRS